MPDLEWHQLTATHLLHQEVGEDSKLARSFERIRSIVRRKRLARKEKQRPKLEQIVNEVLERQRTEKARIKSSNKHYLTVEFPQKPLYRHSYQVSGMPMRVFVVITIFLPGVSQSAHFRFRFRIWDSAQNHGDTSFGRVVWGRVKGRGTTRGRRTVIGSRSQFEQSAGAFRKKVFTPNVFRFRDNAKR